MFLFLIIYEGRIYASPELCCKVPNKLLQVCYAVVTILLNLKNVSPKSLGVCFFFCTFAPELTKTLYVYVKTNTDS